MSYEATILLLGIIVFIVFCTCAKDFEDSRKK